MARARPRCEIWNVRARKIAVLRTYHARQRGMLVDTDPQLVEETVAVERIVQEIRMQALGKQHAVCARGPDDDADRIVRKPPDRTIGSKERLALARQHAVDECETVLDGVAVIHGVEDA